jgi:hypothetical protein
MSSNSSEERKECEPKNVLEDIVTEHFQICQKTEIYNFKNLSEPQKG